METRFSKDGDYSEYGNLSPNKIKPSAVLRGGESDPTPKITELSDGDYEALRYGYTVELKDGRRFRTPYGVRNNRTNCGGFQRISMKDGNMTLRNTTRFSGIAEMGGALQGRSYGTRPQSTSDVTRLTLDAKGFKIPEKVTSAFKLNTKNFSMELNKNGAYQGNTGAPKLAINDDNSIIRSKGSTSKLDATTPLMPNKMTNTSLEWNKDEAFHLAVEPWLTSNLQSDTDDGLYLGTIKGDKIDTGNKVITLMVSIKVDYPESVLVLVKNKKAFIFKQSMLSRTTGSKIFSTVLFSEIKSEEQFRDYTHNLMQNAHKDKYDPKKTDKVVDGVLKSSADFGEAIGKVKSGLKKFSDLPGAVESDFEKMDSNKDGFITKKEWEAEFKRLDTNKDGEVTKDEWVAGGKSPIEFHLINTNGDNSINEHEWSEEFDRMDTNKDGKISRLEWFDHQSGNRKVYRKEFNIVDQNHDGVITKDEWDKEFQTVDANKDGVIDSNEWVNAGRSKFEFDILDTDQDGKISKVDWDEEFDKLDTNKDGKVSRGEWNLHYSDAYDYVNAMFADPAEFGAEESDEEKAARLRAEADELEAKAKAKKEAPKSDESPKPEESEDNKPKFQTKEQADAKAKATAEPEPEEPKPEEPKAEEKPRFQTKEQAEAKAKAAVKPVEAEKPVESNKPDAFKAANPDQSPLATEKTKENPVGVSSIDPSQVTPVKTPEEPPVKPSTETGNEAEYRFDVQPTEPRLEMQCLVGTLVMSPAYVHLFHLVTHDYASHMALEEYYKKMPELVDDLAENYLATTSATNFQVCIVPTSLDPVKYLEDLQKFVKDYSAEKLQSESLFQSLVDDINKLIGVTLYRLKRLKAGGKVFSFIRG